MRYGIPKLTAATALLSLALLSGCSSNSFGDSAQTGTLEALESQQRKDKRQCANTPNSRDCEATRSSEVEPSSVFHGVVVFTSCLLGLSECDD